MVCVRGGPDELELIKGVHGQDELHGPRSVSHFVDTWLAFQKVVAVQACGVRTVLGKQITTSIQECLGHLRGGRDDQYAIDGCSEGHVLFLGCSLSVCVPQAQTQGDEHDQQWKQELLHGKTFLNRMYRHRGKVPAVGRFVNDASLLHWRHMKKQILIGFSIVLLGAGCAGPVMEVSEKAVETVEVQAEKTGQDILEPSVNETRLADGEIGFTVDSELYGDLSVVYLGSAYGGTFENESRVKYTATDPEDPPGRGGWLGDTNGYVQEGDGFAAQFLDVYTLPIQEHMIVEEFDGQMILLRGEEKDGPSPWPGPGQHTLLVNTPNGPIKGGTFYGTLTESEWYNLIQAITIMK